MSERWKRRADEQVKRSKVLGPGELWRHEVPGGRNESVIFSCRDREETSVFVALHVYEI